MQTIMLVLCLHCIPKLRDLLQTTEDTMVPIHEQYSRILAQELNWDERVTALESKLENVTTLRGLPGRQGQKGAKGCVQLHRNTGIQKRTVK